MKRDRSLGIFSFLNIVFAIFEAFIVIKVSSLSLAQPDHPLTPTNKNNLLVACPPCRNNPPALLAPSNPATALPEFSNTVFWSLVCKKKLYNTCSLNTVLHSPSLAVCSKPTDLPIEKSKHQRKELSYFFAWNFLVKTQVCTTTTITFIIFTRKPFFSIGIYATSSARNFRITNIKVLAALTYKHSFDYNCCSFKCS